MYLYPENLPAGSMPKTKGVPYSWKISQPHGNDEGTDISKYSSLGAPDTLFNFLQIEFFKLNGKKLLYFPLQIAKFHTANACRETSAHRI